jgi:hypothetical protein
MRKLIFMLIVLPILLFGTPNHSNQTIGVLDEGTDWAVWGGTITIAAQGTTYVTTPVLVGYFNSGLFELISAESLRVEYRMASLIEDLTLHSWQLDTVLIVKNLYEKEIIKNWLFRPYLQYRLINTDVSAGTDTVDLRISMKEQ